MAITSSAGAGIEVTTAAMNETLVSQSQNNGVDEITVSDTLANQNNGNITAPTGYVGRMCILRQGGGDEETRLITGDAAGTGNTRILTVNEAWVSQPVVTTDTIHVSYSSDDMEAFTGMSLNSKTGVYEGGTGREWAIGQGTNFAYAAMFNYQGWESPDRGSTEAGIEIENNGRLDIGYVQGGEAIQGGIITSINNADAELSFEVKAGGIARINAALFRSWLNKVGFAARATADVVCNATTFKDYTDDFLMLVGTWDETTIAGGGGTGELLRVAEEATITNLLVAGLAGITTEASDTTTETLTIRNVTFIDTQPLLVIESNKTWDIINPTWTVDEASQDDLSFSTATSNEVNERYSLDPVVQDAAGTKKNGARVFVYEGLRLDDLVQELTADSDGLAPGNWVYKNYVEATATTLTVLTDGNHALRVDNYGDFPFVAALTSNALFAGAVVINPDPAIAEATQATAITDGSGVTFNTDTNPSEIADFTSGSGTGLEDMILTFSPSGAIGTLTFLIEGDSTAGTMHLKTRNATAIANGDTFSRTGGTAGTFSGTYTNNTKQSFSRWIDGNGKTLQVIHDYFAARTAEASGTFTAEAEVIHEWGKENEARVLYLGANGWFTNRSAGEGVIIVDYTTGTVEKFTDDAGVSYVPPTTETVSFEAVDSADAAIQSVQVSAYAVDDDTEIILADTNASGFATTSYTGTTPRDVYYRYRKSSTGAQKYINISGFATISSGTGLTVKRTMFEDDIADPSI